MKTTFAFALLIAVTMLLGVKMPRRAERQPHAPECFTALGDLAGGAIRSDARGISADGSVVVGCSNSENGMEAFRWTRRGGMERLGFPEAFASSADGSIIVGYRCVGEQSEPVRWSPHAGPQSLGTIAGFAYGKANGVSADGSVIVGDFDPHDAGQGRAFMWSQSGSLAPLNGLSSDVIGTESHAVSSDGTVVVGSMYYKSGRRAAFRWSANQGFIDLGPVSAGSGSVAHAVSADGSVVVGLAETTSTAFRWSEAAGMIDLGALPGGGRSCAFGASADGSIVVGQSDSDCGQEAFIWDPVHGMRSLRRLLMSQMKLDGPLRHWKLRAATAVSYDGSIIVGCGINSSGNGEGWIARLGQKSSAEIVPDRFARR